jgi:hypothetical protein
MDFKRPRLKTKWLKNKDVYKHGAEVIEMKSTRETGATNPTLNLSTRTSPGSDKQNPACHLNNFFDRRNCF